MSNTARAAAVSALVRTENSGYSNLVMKSAPLEQLSAEDRAFCTSIVYGTLSRIYTLDAVLLRCTDRPLEKLDAPVRAILRSGLYQISYMNSVPDHAAVDESVKLAKSFKKSSAAGFVNAVLRRAARIDTQQMLRGIKDPALSASVKFSVHPSLAKMLAEQYPDKWEGMLEAAFAPPEYFVRVNTLKTDLPAAEQLLKQAGARVERCFLPGALRIDSASAALKLQQRGLVGIQGLWSQYAAASVRCREGERVFDMCAAPGGKSAAMAQHMNNNGEILAFDKSEKRLETARGLFEREGIEIVKTCAADASVFEPSRGYADAVLCDVPCSGYGMLAYKPELRQKPPEDFAQLPQLQYAILCAGAKYVKKGGRLVYSTCTVNRTENEQVVRRFLAENSGFKVCAPLALPEIYASDAQASEFTAILPQDASRAGFFAATMERV